MITRLLQFLERSILRFLDFVEGPFAVVHTSRFSIAAAVAGVLLLGGTDQGRDSARELLAEGFSLRQALFLAAVLLWAHNVFYGARILLSLRQAREVQGRPAEWLAVWGPRLLGLAGIAAVWVTLSLIATLVQALRMLPGFVLIAAAYSGYVLFRVRRRLASSGSAMPLIGASEQFQDLGRGARWFVWTTLGVLALFIVLFTAWPVAVGPAFGALALHFLGCALWLIAGSGFVYLGRKGSFPVLTSLLIVICVFSLVNDNHALRRAGPPSPPAGWRGI